MSYDSSALFQQLRSGDRPALAQAITLIESELASQKDAANELLRLCIPFSTTAMFIGITGVPGVGKSTMLNALGMNYIVKGHRVAVLAIDPSSTRTKGSIMGDKTRMDELSQHENAFIRPSPTSGVLGGVSRRTREAGILCAAAGYDRIFIETVGVGQNELEIDELADLTLLLLLAGAGDELQGIKRGIMEAADIMAINKVEGDNEKAGKRAATELRNALTLMPARDSGLRAKVFTCSAVENSNVEDISEHIESLYTELKNKGIIEKRRTQRKVDWMGQRIQDALLEQLNSKPIREQIKTLEKQINTGQTDPISAAEQILAFMRKGPETPS